VGGNKTDVYSQTRNCGTGVRRHTVSSDVSSSVVSVSALLYLLVDVIVPLFICMVVFS